MNITSKLSRKLFIIRSKEGDVGLNIKVNNCKNDSTIFNTKNWVEYTDEIKKALEKQVPKKVITITKETNGREFKLCFCSSCYVKIESEYKYCLNCGQKLDWEV